MINSHTWCIIWSIQRGKNFENKNKAEKRLWYEITARKYKVNPLALNLNHNIEKIIDCNPYFLCFCTVSWFSRIFHASLLLLAHKNILFHLILVGGRYLNQVPRCQAINSNYFDLHFLLLLILREFLSCGLLMFSSKLPE